jgi:hypothetical protein
VKTAWNIMWSKGLPPIVTFSEFITTKSKAITSPAW